MQPLQDRTFLSFHSELNLLFLCAGYLCLEGSLLVLSVLDLLSAVSELSQRDQWIIKDLWAHLAGSSARIAPVLRSPVCLLEKGCSGSIQKMVDGLLILHCCCFGLAKKPKSVAATAKLTP